MTPGRSASASLTRSAPGPHGCPGACTSRASPGPGSAPRPRHAVRSPSRSGRRPPSAGADLVVVQGGLNDWDRPRAEVRTGFKRLIRRCAPTTCPRIVIVGPAAAPSRAAAVPRLDRLLSRWSAQRGIHTSRRSTSSWPTAATCCTSRPPGTSRSATPWRPGSRRSPDGRARAVACGPDARMRACLLRWPVGPKAPCRLDCSHTSVTTARSPSPARRPAAGVTDDCGSRGSSTRRARAGRRGRTGGISRRPTLDARGPVAGHPVRRHLDRGHRRVGRRHGRPADRACRAAPAVRHPPGSRDRSRPGPRGAPRGDGEAGVTRLSGAGVGVPGPVDFHRGVSVSPPIMPGWDGYPVRDAVSRDLGCPVVLDNDVNVLAVGEQHAGVAKARATSCSSRSAPGSDAGSWSTASSTVGSTGAPGHRAHPGRRLRTQLRLRQHRVPGSVRGRCCDRP